jgi:hypothetical protein
MIMGPAGPGTKNDCAGEDQPTYHIGDLVEHVERFIHKVAYSRYDIKVKLKVLLGLIN